MQKNYGVIVLIEKWEDFFKIVSEQTSEQESSEYLTRTLSFISKLIPSLKKLLSFQKNEAISAVDVLIDGFKTDLEKISIVNREIDIYDLDNQNLLTPLIQLLIQSIFSLSLHKKEIQDLREEFIFLFDSLRKIKNEIDLFKRQGENNLENALKMVEIFESSLVKIKYGDYYSRFINSAFRNTQAGIEWDLVVIGQYIKSYEEAVKRKETLAFYKAHKDGCSAIQQITDFCITSGYYTEKPSTVIYDISFRWEMMLKNLINEIETSSDISLEKFKQTWLSKVNMAFLEMFNSEINAVHEKTLNEKDFFERVTQTFPEGTQEETLKKLVSFFEAYFNTVFINEELEINEENEKQIPKSIEVMDVTFDTLKNLNKKYHNDTFFSLTFTKMLAAAFHNLAKEKDTFRNIVSLHKKSFPNELDFLGRTNVFYTLLKNPNANENALYEIFSYFISLLKEKDQETLKNLLIDNLLSSAIERGFKNIVEHLLNTIVFLTIKQDVESNNSFLEKIFYPLKRVDFSPLQKSTDNVQMLMKLMQYGAVQLLPSKFLIYTPLNITATLILPSTPLGWNVDSVLEEIKQSKLPREYWIAIYQAALSKNGADFFTNAKLIALEKALTASQIPVSETEKFLNEALTKIKILDRWYIYLLNIDNYYFQKEIKNEQKNYFPLYAAGFFISLYVAGIFFNELCIKNNPTQSFPGLLVFFCEALIFAVSILALLGFAIATISLFESKELNKKPLKEIRLLSAKQKESLSLLTEELNDLFSIFGKNNVISKNDSENLTPANLLHWVSDVRELLERYRLEFSYTSAVPITFPHLTAPNREEIAPSKTSKMYVKGWEMNVERPQEVATTTPINSEDYAAGLRRRGRFA